MHILGIALPERETPLVLVWAATDRPAGLMQFDRPEHWAGFVCDSICCGPEV